MLKITDYPFFKCIYRKPMCLFHFDVSLFHSPPSLPFHSLYKQWKKISPGEAYKINKQNIMSHSKVSVPEASGNLLPCAVYHTALRSTTCTSTSTMDAGGLRNTSGEFFPEPFPSMLMCSTLLFLFP